MVSIRVTPNSQPVKINIVGGSQFGRFSKISIEKTWNMYVSTANAESQDDSQFWLINYPGYRRVLNIFPYPDPYPTNPTYLPSQLPLGQGRGMYNCIRGNFVILVVNANVYSLSNLLNLTLIGTLKTTSGEVFIAENLNSQVCIVDGVNAYIYDYSLGIPNLTIQTDGALGTGSLVPSYVEYHNSFFLFGNANATAAGAFWYAYKFSTNAAANNAIVQTSQLALQTKADYALAVKRIPGQSNQVIVFGETVSEIWNQVGGLQNYIRMPTVNINYGIASVNTIGESGDMIAWLAINEEEVPSIMVYSGRGLERISTDGIDYQLTQIQFPKQSTAVLFRMDGHLFYQLTFYNSVDNVTFLYDFNTKMFVNLSDQYMNYHPMIDTVYFNNTLYFLSLNNAALYELNADVTVIDENLYPAGIQNPPNLGLVFNIWRERITNSIRQANATRFRANSLVVTLEQGTDVNYMEGSCCINTALITEKDFNPALTKMATQGEVAYILASNIPGIDDPYFNPRLTYTPHIDLAFSKDGGITWSNYVRRNMHFLGHRQNILHWENMGVANDLTFKFVFWGNNRWIVNNGLLDVVS